MADPPCVMQTCWVEGHMRPQGAAWEDVRVLSYAVWYVWLMTWVKERIHVGSTQDELCVHLMS